MRPRENRRFEDFAERKTREAAAARIETLSTMFERRDEYGRRGIGNAWTRARYGGDFPLVTSSEGETAISLVFVQSADRNTEASDPASLGGGETDKHLIYEGLSRAAADAVLAGARTVHAEAFFSVWHPELTALRGDLGLPRHPAQIVISRRGRLDFNALLFDVPDVPVFLIAGNEALSDRQRWLRERPWVRHIPLMTDDLRPIVDRLRREEGIDRISAVGGRVTASRLVDEGLVQDLYLTTTPRPGGGPDTPWYSGALPPQLLVDTRKEWLDSGSTVVFEHILIGAHRSAAAER
jgi:riboflavin biosynthesis pyrimidine reductase